MSNEDQALRERALTLHVMIMAGDVTAPAELAELVLPILTERLGKKYPNIFDPDLIDIAVTDAILNYFAHPDRYKPEILSLISYLFMSANGDLLNYLQPKSVDRNSLQLSEDVELRDRYSEIPTVSVVAVDDANVEEDAFALLSSVNSKLQDLFPDPGDQELVALLMTGVRETEEYAKALGIDHLSFSEQQEIVKNHKDRIKKMITRKIDPKELKDDK
jgi:hypothetical protein